MPLNSKEASGYLKDLREWKLASGARSIRAEYAMKDFMAAILLIEEIAEIAEDLTAGLEGVEAAFQEALSVGPVKFVGQTVQIGDNPVAISDLRSSDCRWRTAGTARIRRGRAVFPV